MWREILGSGAGHSTRDGMRRLRAGLMVVGLVWGLASGRSAHGQYPERIVEQNGVLYRETTVIDRRPVTEVEWQEQVQYAQLPQHFTTLREEYRWVSVPVVEYQFQPWPQGGGQWIPVTRWEQRQQRVRIPLNGIETVSEARRVQTPVRKLSFVDEPRVERVALTPNAPPPPVFSGTAPANYPANYPSVPPPSPSPALSNSVAPWSSQGVNSGMATPGAPIPPPITAVVPPSARPSTGWGFGSAPSPAAVPGRFAERKELSPTWSAGWGGSPWR